MAVGEVAPAVAGGQQLAAYPALPLQQRHPVPGVGESRQRRHQAGGPAADDADLTHGAVAQPLAGEIALQHQGRRHGIHHLFALFGVLSIVK